MSSSPWQASRLLTLAALAVLTACGQALLPGGKATSPTIRERPDAARTYRVFALSSKGYVPDSVITAADGSVWFSAMRVAHCQKKVGCRREEFGKASKKGITESPFGPVSSSVFGVAAGPDSTLWLTDAKAAAYVFSLRGVLVDKVSLEPVGGAQTPPFAGPDGRIWFDSGSGDIVAVDSSFHLVRIAACRSCRLRGGVTAPDGNAWFFRAPALGGLVRVTPARRVTTYLAGQHLVDSLTAGPNSALWGVLGNQIVEYSTAPQFVRSFDPSIDPSQSGLKPFAGAVYWATYQSYGDKRNILYFVSMTWTGDFVEEHEIDVGACDATDRAFFASGPTYGGDGHYYIGVGCSPLSAPYTTGGSGYIVRL